MMKNSIYNDLLVYLKRPELYERTTEKFWTDPHISAQMLKSHLDPVSDGASRPHDFMDRSADWIVSLLPKNANLLDIGCGPGLYTKRFATRGLQVTGIDFSSRSINYSKEHDEKSRYIELDYLAMDFENVFDVVTLINCDYGALIPNEREILLGKIQKALKPGGLFLFDVFTPLISKDKKNFMSWKLCPDGGFMSPAPHILLEAEYYYEKIAAGRRIVIIEEQNIRCFNLWDCYFTKNTILDETARAGFREAGFYGDVTGKTYSDDSGMFCAVLQKCFT